MVDFEKVLTSLQENTEKMSVQLEGIQKSTDKLYKTEEKESKREQDKDKKAKVKEQRDSADNKSGNKIKDALKSTIDKSKKESGDGPDISPDLMGLLIGAGVAIAGRTWNTNGGLTGLLWKGFKQKLGPLGNFIPFADGGMVYQSPAKALANGGGVGPFQVPGIMTGDKHPMMLPTGSFVLNRRASEYLQSGGYAGVPAPLGYQEGGMTPVVTESKELIFPPSAYTPFLEGLNKSIPRFQSGGIVEHIHGDPSRKGFDLAGHGTESNAHDHFAFESRKIRDMVESELIKKGYEIGSKDRPGDPGYHGSGQALDIPWHQFGSGKIGEQDYKKSRQLEKDVKEILRANNIEAENKSKMLQDSGMSAGAANFLFGVDPAEQKSRMLQDSGMSAASANTLTSVTAPPTNSITGDIKQGDINKSNFGSLLAMASPTLGPALFGAQSGLTDMLKNITSNLGKGLNEVGKNIFGDLFGGGGSKDTPPSVTAPAVTKGSKGLLDFIAHYESGGDYNKIFGGKSVPGLTEMTIKEVVQTQRKHLKEGYESAAIGRYQMMYPDIYASRAGLSQDDKFSKKNQDKMAMVYLEEDGWSKFKSGKMSAETFANNVAGTWAALPMPGGQSAHAGVGSNKSLVGRDTYMKQINASKLQQGGFAGMDPVNSSKLQQGGFAGMDPVNSSKLQQGGFAGMTPVMVESGEKIFTPGSFGPEIPQLNSSVPRFATGGVIPGKNSITERFHTMSEMNRTSNSVNNTPIVVPMPMPEDRSQASRSHNTTDGTTLPSLSNSPGNHITQALMMQTYSLMRSIG